MTKWTVQEEAGSITILAWFGDERDPTEMATFGGAGARERATAYLMDEMVPMLREE
jgi:hypothetical protein